MKRLALVAALAVGTFCLYLVATPASAAVPNAAAMLEGQTRCGSEVCLGSGTTGVNIVGYAKIQQNQATTAAPGDAGTAAAHFEYDQVALSSGTKTVTFKHTFTSPPICTCSDTNTTAAACDSTGVTTTAVTLKGTSADVVNFICIGDR